MNKRTVVKVLTLIVMLGVIFAYSSQTADASTDLANDILLFFNFDLNKHFMPLRKFAHFFEYLVLACIVFVNIIAFSKDSRRKMGKKHIFFTVLFCFLFACTDEFHQLFVPGRSGQATDVLIDTLGGVTGAFLSYFIYKELVKRR